MRRGWKLLGGIMGAGAALAGVIAGRRAARGPEPVTESPGGARGGGVQFVAAQVARQAVVAVDEVTEATAQVASHTGELARRASRAAAYPADRALFLARERLLDTVPEAADTKWRDSALLLRQLIASAVASDAAQAAEHLDHAGAAYGRAVQPEGAWDVTTLRETSRRLVGTLEMTGPVRRIGGERVEIVTTRCRLLEVTEPDAAPALCEAVCGERRSLLSGFAGAAAAHVESPERMGAGDARCLRRFVLTHR
jgi:hypothetical protein